MSDLPAPPGARALRSLLDKHGVTPSRALGQNFVIDPNTVRKVVDVAEIGPEDDVLEIGAGPGPLTLALAAVARSVVALELDERILPVLEEATEGVANVRIVHADAKTTDLSVFDAGKVVANLPYNIAAQLVLKVLQEVEQVRELTVMTQREVGERLAAGPGSKTYGLTSVLVAFHASARVAARISRSVFFPVPNVDSVLVKIVRRSDSHAVDPGRFNAVARAAFAQRRKTIRNALVAGDFEATRVDDALAAASIQGSDRAERIAPESFVALTEALGE